jgi:hypothetical protein
MTRDEALAKLAEPLYDPDELEIDIAYFCKKLKINRDQFDELMKVPIHKYSDFPTWDTRYRVLKTVQALVSKVTGKRIRVYS